jgi:hypothetical protein
MMAGVNVTTHSRVVGGGGVTTVDLLKAAIVAADSAI